MNRDTNSGVCEDCEKLVEERCNDGYCRACHVSLSFESCVDESWADDLYAGTGVLPPRLRGLR